MNDYSLAVKAQPGDGNLFIDGIQMEAYDL
jgi:hypothetical protein